MKVERLKQIRELIACRTTMYEEKHRETAPLVNAVRELLEYVDTLHEHIRQRAWNLTHMADEYEDPEGDPDVFADLAEKRWEELLRLIGWYEKDKKE